MDRNREREEQDKKITNALGRIRNKIIVMSGKGGVGKSTMAVNIAAGLADRGYRVGLMDTDLHGPNVLKMLGLEKEKINSAEGGLFPLYYSPHLAVMSIAALLQTSDTPVIWRGPLKIGVIRQFLSDVQWEDLDYLVVDSPPGTGDEPLTVAQTIPDARAVIVTTPQEISLLDVKKSITFCEQLKLKILGIIENMAYFNCPHCGKQVDLFKTGGGGKLAGEKGLKLLGFVPFETAVMESSDAGRPYITGFKDTETGKAFKHIIDGITGKKEV